MAAPIKILQIAPDYQVTLFMKLDGSTIRSRVPLEKALKMLKEETFDLIIDEINNRAILDPQNSRNEQWTPVNLFRGPFPIINN